MGGGGVAFILLIALLTVADPSVRAQDNDVGSEDEFIDDGSSRRGGDEWWRNYESIEEQANSFDDHLEMIYTYRVNPLDLVKPKTTATSINPSEIINKSKAQLHKVTKPIQLAEATEAPFVRRNQQATVQLPPTTTAVPIQPQVPVRRRRPSTAVPFSSTEKQLQLASYLSPTQAPQLQSQQVVSPQPRPFVQPPQFIPPQPPRFTPTQQPRFTPTQQPRFTPTQPPLFTPTQQPRFTPTQQPRFTPTQPPLFTPTQPPPTTQQALFQVATQTPPFQIFTSPRQPQFVAPQFTPTQSPQQPPGPASPQTTDENFPTNQPPSTVVAEQTSIPSTPSLPLRFIPGPRPLPAKPQLPFNFKAIPNAIPLPAYLFQPKQKPRAASTTPAQFNPAASPATFIPTTLVNPPELIARPVNSQQRRVRVRKPTTQATESPNLDDKQLFDVVVPRKSNINSARRVAANAKSENLTPLSAQSTSNEPQSVSLNQTDPTNHPFLQSTPSENLPRYVRLLNRYSLINTNSTNNEPNNLLSNQTNHPASASARVFNDNGVKKAVNKQGRRRRPTTTAAPQNDVTDTITSDSEESPSFNRINSRNSRSRTTTTTAATTPSARSRRFGGGQTTTTAGTATVPSSTTARSAISRRPLRRKGFGHQTTTTTTTESNENIEGDDALLTNNVKLEAENETSSGENNTDVAVEIEEIATESVDISPKGLRRRKFNFKNPASSSSAAAKPLNKLKVNNSTANQKPVGFLKAKQSQPRPKVQSASTTTAAPTVESSTKRRFRFKPKVTKSNTEIPSTTEAWQTLELNDTVSDYENVEQVETTTTEATTTVSDRVKPGRGNLFARPGSIKRARTVPSVTTTTTKPAAVSTTKKPFVSRFRSTTTAVPTTSAEGEQLNDAAVAETVKTTQKRLFSPRTFQTTPSTLTVTSTTPLTTTYPNSGSTTLAARKRRRRPLNNQQQPVTGTSNAVELSATLPTTTIPTSTANTEILNPFLDLNNNFNSNVTQDQINPLVTANDSLATLQAPANNNNKRRKLRRRKLSQRSTTAVESLHSTTPVGTFSSTQQSDITTTTASQQIKESTDNFTKEKTKAQAKKELLEKIAIKSATHKFQQNGFTFNTDEPLIMEADDSGVWFSNPDESSASDSRSPPLSFLPNSKSSKLVQISDGKRLIHDPSISSNSNDTDSWFSTDSAADATESVDIDRKDEEPVDQTTASSSNKNENQPKIKTSRTATFSVSSSTSVQSEMSKRRSSSSFGKVFDIPTEEPKQSTTTSKTTVDDGTTNDEDDGFHIMELGPPRVIVIDKVTLDDPQTEAKTTRFTAEEPTEKEPEQATERTDTTSTTSSPSSRSNGRLTSERRNSGRDRSGRNRGSTTTTTTTTTTTEASTTAASTEQTTTSSETETPRSSSDEVGYFGPEEVVPEARGALDGPLDDTQYESGGIFEDREQNANDEVASVNVSEHNDDEGAGHQSEPAPGDEASIWELSALTDYADHFSQSSSFNVEVRSKAPATIQLPYKRDIVRSVTELSRAKYEDYDDKNDELFNKLQGLKYDTTIKSFDNYDIFPRSSNILQKPENSEENGFSVGPKSVQFLDGPNNCSRSERNVCPISNDDYPRLLVENTVKQHEKTLRDLWKTLEADRNPAQIYPEDNEDESSKHDLSVCDSTVETFRPGWARDARDDKWKIIINTPAFPQFIRTELCLRLNKECLFISPYYRSSCTEHHSAHRLVSIDPEKPSAVPAIGIFKFPCGCSCKVEMFHGRK